MHPMDSTLNEFQNLKENYKLNCFELCKTVLTLDVSFLSQLQTVFPEILHYSIIKHDI